jgi:hypothetical protein
MLVRKTMPQEERAEERQLEWEKAVDRYKNSLFKF